MNFIFLPPPPQSDPRFISTLKQILKTPEKGGLTSNVRFFFFFFLFILFSGIQISKNFVLQGLVYRYDVSKSSDGVAGEEGTFCMCTLWYVFFILLFFFSFTK